MRFNDWLRGKNRGSDGEVEYYEDTHDEHGNYVGKSAFAPQNIQGAQNSQSGFAPQSFQQRLTAPSAKKDALPEKFTEQFSEAGKNIIVYKPTTTKEVETLIRCLQRGESAVANLNDLEDSDAQRILDFLSGATFALGGNVYRITGNIFLLSPSGVAIQSYK